MNWKVQFFVAANLLTINSQVMSQSLEQSVATTLSTNPDIRSAFNEFKSRVEASNSASGAYLPSLDVNAGVGYEDIDPANNEPTELTRKDVALTFTQLIWDGASTWNDIDRTTAEAESMRYQLLSDAQNMALEVIEVYISAIRAEDILVLSEKNLTIHNRIFSDIQKRANSGIGSTADLVQVKARLARANTNLLAAQNNLYDVHTQFTRVVGRPPSELVRPFADSSMLPESLEDAVDMAYQQHPIVKVASSDIDAANYQYKQTKGNYYPSFSFEASQTWKDDADGIEGSSDEFSAMIRMRYNLFNGGSDSANSERAAYQLNKSKDLRDRAYRMLEEGTRLSWSALTLNNQQRTFLQEHVDAASETVTAYEKQFKIGKRTLLDLLNTENELFEARKAFVEGNYSLELAKYRVLNATGALLTSLRVETPQEWNQSLNGSGNSEEVN
ncbi:MAG: TolC family outer membrane protein [Aliivibrio sp.]|uniref:TolC family outer membrane protein n=1 Tax=Aliivibrio sp. TaxID=1872443 RepID=UPI001A5D52C1|nr:TolC family outer membrane protein [Aliivibrio sp.]